MESLWMVLWVLLLIVAVVDVMRVNLATSKKVLWVMLMFFVPVVGLILYYLLGRPDQAQS
jgi:putative effector of murein hydrolase LrgA (UPF0299 family)